MQHEQKARLVARMRRSLNADGTAFDRGAIPAAWVAELHARIRRIRRRAWGDPGRDPSRLGIPFSFAVALSRHVHVLRDSAATERAGLRGAAKDGRPASPV
jgi:hypothetical protein